jgi:hypothetical protein
LYCHTSTYTIKTKLTTFETSIFSEQFIYTDASSFLVHKIYFGLSCKKAAGDWDAKTTSEPPTLQNRSATPNENEVGKNLQSVRSAYQPPASRTFLLEQTSHQQPASSTLLSEQTSTSHQPPANRTGWSGSVEKNRVRGGA